MSRPDWQQRVIEEKAELDGKIARLAVFFSTGAFAQLPAVEKVSLDLQYDFMGGYSRALTSRISRFT